MAGAETPGTAQAGHSPGAFWIRLVAGLAVVWALFQAMASALGSIRGERGLLVAAAVVAALLAVEWSSRATGSPLWPIATLFAPLPAPMAAASVLLAVATAFPAHLFAMGGGNVWAPALLHGTIQAIKLIERPAAHALEFPLGWMLCAAAIPYLAFVAPRERAARLPRTAP